MDFFEGYIPKVNGALQATCNPNDDLESIDSLPTTSYKVRRSGQNLNQDGKKQKWETKLPRKLSSPNHADIAQKRQRRASVNKGSQSFLIIHFHRTYVRYAYQHIFEMPCRFV